MPKIDKKTMSQGDECQALCEIKKQSKRWRGTRVNTGADGMLMVPPMLQLLRAGLEIKARDKFTDTLPSSLVSNDRLSYGETHPKLSSVPTEILRGCTAVIAISTKKDTDASRMIC